MKKFTIQNITIIINNKEKINIICLECKDDKYVLYSGKYINEKNIDNNVFTKFEFNENLQITPKKKLTELFLTINTNNNLYSLLWNNNPVYFLKNSKNIQINDSNLKLILSNGSLYGSPLNIEELLQKNKKVDNTIKEVIIKYNKEVINNIVENKINDDSVNDSVNDTINDTINDSVNDSVNDTINDSVNDNNEEVINDEINNDCIKEVIIKYNKEVINNKNIEDVVENEINDTYNKVLNLDKKLFESTPCIDSSSTGNTCKELKYSENENIESLNSIKNINFTKNIVNNNVEIKKIEDMNDNLEKIKNISDIINKEKNDLDKKKIEIENNVFNLEDVLLDFNKLFKSIGENKIINTDATDTNINTYTESKINNVTKINTESKIDNVENIIKNTKKINMSSYITKIQYSNILYKLTTIKLYESNELNFLNLYQSKIVENNIINKSNIAFELENINSSYLIMYFNQKYLINKVDNTIILTNLSNKKYQIIKNKENFKLGLYDYMLYNDSTLLIPMINKKIFDNSYGTSYNMYVPKI